MVVIGPNLKRAAWLAVEIEALASQYWHALQVGVPYILPDEEIANVAEKFKSYGQGDDGTKRMPSCC
jgi:L-fuculose-phosphate aldolase